MADIQSIGGRPQAHRIRTRLETPGCPETRRADNLPSSSSGTSSARLTPFTKTDRYPARRAALAKQLGVSEDEADKRYAAQFPIGRIVEPSDIAPMVLFLASKQASAITGQSIAVDGGSTPGIFY